MTPVLELYRLSKRLGDVFALMDIALELDRGEVHMVIGENGSGKSVLMKIIAGIYHQDSGEIRFKGNNWNSRDIADSRKEGILYLGQEIQLFDNFSVAENLFFEQLPRNRWGKINIPRLYKDCRDLLAKLQIPLDPHDLTGRLGYAQRRLLETAKACVGNWELVIFDEPTAAISETEREIIFGIVRVLKERGTTILYVSHRLDETFKIGDRVSLVHHGRLVATRRVDSLDQESLLTLMTGELHTERYPKVRHQLGKPILETRELSCPGSLDAVNLSVRKGEILGITGLMGSGRTSLAECLSGATRPLSGTILIDGLPVSFGHPAEAIARGVTLLPEDRVEKVILHRQDLTLNVAVSALSRFSSQTGLDLPFMQATVKNYASRLDLLPGSPGDIPDSYSGGNQQKVAVARALAMHARVYLLDEPTRGVDIASKVDIYNAISELSAKGSALIILSSDIEEILGLCDRIIVLSAGRIVCDLPREKANQKDILEYASGAR